MLHNLSSLPHRNNGKIFEIFDDDFLSLLKVLRRTSLALKVSKNAGPRELCLKYKIQLLIAKK